ncbi:MAG TPA: hypothetical protein VEY33_11750 [Gemmatimonadota bacterium]|nr:hypothetical protein [Gemmatimonadota bacterium]
MDNRVVVLLADGTRVKGFSRVFNPLEVTYHLRLAGPDGETGEHREIQFTETQAVFFVRDFAFDRDRRYEPEDDLTPMTRPPSVGGRALRVRTAWGEALVGLTYDYRPEEPGFFLFPTDPLNRTLNLERAYVMSGAVEEVEFTEPERET